MSPGATISLTPKRVFQILLIIWACIAVASYALRFEGVLSGVPQNRKLDVDSENSLPSYYEAAALFAGGALFWIIGILKKRDRAPFWRHWKGAGVVFTLMSIDEGISIHEPLGDMIRAKLGTHGAFYFAWVIPGMVCVALFFAAYWKFLAHLGTRHRRLLVASAAVYVCGAVGMELIGGRYAETHGLDDMVYVTMTTIEETLEMVGSALLIYTLLDYLREYASSLKLTFGSASLDRRHDFDPGS